VGFSMFVQLAAYSRNCDSMLWKLKPIHGKLRFRLQHSVSCLLCPARFGNHNDKRLRKPIAYPVKHAIETVRIGIIEEKDIHRVVRRAERLCDKFRSERRAADPNVE